MSLQCSLERGVMLPRQSPEIDAVPLQRSPKKKRGAAETVTRNLEVTLLEQISERHKNKRTLKESKIFCFSQQVA